MIVTQNSGHIGFLSRVWGWVLPFEKAAIICVDLRIFAVASLGAKSRVRETLARQTRSEALRSELDPWSEPEL